VHCSTIENYKSDKHGFDGIAALTSMGNFLTVFFGAFALGCGMGCVTALVTSSAFILAVASCSVVLRTTSVK